MHVLKGQFSAFYMKYNDFTVQYNWKYFEYCSKALKYCLGSLKMQAVAWKGTLKTAAQLKSVANPQSEAGSGLVCCGPLRTRETLEFVFSLTNALESTRSLIPFVERWKL